MAETLLVKNALVVTMDAQRRVLDRGYIATRDGKIETVQEGNPKGFKSGRVIDAAGKIAIPGLVCAHNHMYGVFSHGMPIHNPPSSFYGFLKDFWWPQIEDRLGLREISAATELACVQMAKSGTTTFADILEAPNSIPGALNAEGNIVEKSGLRAVLSFEASERAGENKAEESLDENRRFIEKWNRREGLITGMMCTHTLFTCSTEFLHKAKEIAAEHQVGIHIHLEEAREETEYAMQAYGKLPVEVYEAIGFLTPDLLASQCVHTRPDEIKLLKKYDVKLAHMPLSNCEVGGGVAPLKEFLDSGLTVGLGTDGYVTDMFEVMRGAFLIHKGHLQDATVIPAQVAFELATLSGARALRMQDKIGSLEEGKEADIVLLDRALPTPVTSENVYAQLVTFASGSLVDSVIVSGRTIVANHKVKTLNEGDARANCSRVAAGLWRLAN
jgi:cytosine/adenosine deaminase-related metal-dependent hydrolase